MKLQWQNGNPLSWNSQKVVCVGRNYQAHAQELNNPIPKSPFFFIKPSSAIALFSGSWEYPKHLGEIHYELELALLIGKPLRYGASTNEIKQAISGQALALDLTLRQLQTELKSKGLPWEQAKAFDRSCVISPFAETATIPGEEVEVEIRLHINQQLRQRGLSSDMIFSPISLIQSALTYFSFEPGDILLTGTPEGVGALSPGDYLKAELSQALPETSCYSSTIKAELNIIQ